MECQLYAGFCNKMAWHWRPRPFNRGVIWMQVIAERKLGTLACCVRLIQVSLHVFSIRVCLNAHTRHWWRYKADRGQGIRKKTRIKKRRGRNTLSVYIWNRKVTRSNSSSFSLGSQIFHREPDALHIELFVQSISSLCTWLIS